MKKMMMAVVAVLMLAGCTVDPDSCEAECVADSAPNMAKCVRTCNAKRNEPKANGFQG
jgi:uncharacterized lipoprotein YajG